MATPTVVFVCIMAVIVGFLSISYTNILQSIVVVPNVHHSDLAFEEMIRQNFTFESSHPSLIRYNSRLMVSSYATGSRGKEKRFRVLEMHAQLAERIELISTYWNDEFHSFLEEFSPGKKKVLVSSELDVDVFRLTLPRKAGWDVVVGKEEFLKGPAYWSFEDVERGSLLA